MIERGEWLIRCVERVLPNWRAVYPQDDFLATAIRSGRSASNASHLRLYERQAAQMAGTLAWDRSLKTASTSLHNLYAWHKSAAWVAHAGVLVANMHDPPTRWEERQILLACQTSAALIAETHGELVMVLPEEPPWATPGRSKARQDGVVAEVRAQQQARRE